MRHDEGRVVVERTGVEQRHALRHSQDWRGGGIDDRGVVVEDHLRPSGRSAAGHRLPVAGDRIMHRLVGHAVRREVGRHRIRRIPVGLAADDQRGPENVEHRGGFAARQPPGKRCRRRAEFPHRKAGLEEGIAIGQADSDEIAGLYPLGGKGAGAAVGATFELLPAQRVLAMADRNRILWLAIGIPARHVGDRNEHLTPPIDGLFPSPFIVHAASRRDASRPRTAPGHGCDSRRARRLHGRAETAALATPPSRRPHGRSSGPR